MGWDRERRITGAIFAGFLAAGALAMAAAYLVFGRVIVDASTGDAGPMLVIAGGALVGSLTAFVIHEVGQVLPGVMARLSRG